jgi:Na+-translocating ferredoxin:NAD+ oxidoreductase subunit B
MGGATLGALMKDDFERLADALDRLANGFPRTESGVELRILRKMVSREEAALASVMTATPEPVVRIAERAGLEIHEAGQMLKSLARREFVWVSSTPGARGFRLAPFVVGSYEAHMRSRPDAEFAQLVEEYFTAAGWAQGMAAQPALQRVVPARAAVKSEWVLPYDDVRALLLGAKSFVVGDCVCRVQQDLLDHRRCDFPVKACLWFSNSEADCEDVSTQAEALEFLDQIEKIGLVHTVSNVAEGVGYVCNCCGCCCGLLRGINEWGIDDSVAHANYYAEIDPDACTACAVCLGRCQVGAVAESDGAYVVDQARCIGCGLCVTGCASDAATLRPKAPEEMLLPPPDFAAWERQRLLDRGLPG